MAKNDHDYRATVGMSVCFRCGFVEGNRVYPNTCVAETKPQVAGEGKPTKADSKRETMLAESGR